MKDGECPKCQGVDVHVVDGHRFERLFYVVVSRPLRQLVGGAQARFALATWLTSRVG